MKHHLSKMSMLLDYINDCALTEPQFVNVCVETALRRLVAALGSRRGQRQEGKYCDRDS